jgi:glutathione peroxidase
MGNEHHEYSQRALCHAELLTSSGLRAQVEVNGANESPIFQFLKKEVPNSQISWNFSKFLVNRKGQPVKHYESVFDEATLVFDIERELAASSGAVVSA